MTPSRVEFIGTDDNAVYARWPATLDTPGAGHGAQDLVSAVTLVGDQVLIGTCIGTAYNDVPTPYEEIQATLASAIAGIIADNE